jgi:hypothetical protein
MVESFSITAKSRCPSMSNIGGVMFYQRIRKTVHAYVLRRAFVVATTLFALISTPSYAIVCEDNFAKLTEALLKKKRQVPVFSGKASNGFDTTVFMSLGGSWSTVMRFPDGNYCITSEGKSAELFPKEMS